jgi:hypothetical protein
LDGKLAVQMVSVELISANGSGMGEVRRGVAAIVEVFVKDVLRLEGKTAVQVGDDVRRHIAEYEKMFRDAQFGERDKDLAARVCRALCRNALAMETVQRIGTPTEVHLQIALGAVPLPGFSVNDR